MLYNFFNLMLEQFTCGGDKHNEIMNAFSIAKQRSLSFSTRPLRQYREEEQILRRIADPDTFPVEASYNGPRLSFPITREQITNMIASFKDNKVLHVKYVVELLHRARRLLMTLPNINRVSTSLSRQVTVCGDLHGKLDDLYAIFHKDTPSTKQPLLALITYLFDSIDFGRIFAQESQGLYGFTKEVMRKYNENSVKVIRLFNDIFSWLPLATVVDGSVLVVHGGVSEEVHLDYLDTIDRHKYVSVLRPPVIIALEDSSDQQLNIQELGEWKQLLDILWSDPRQTSGCIPNTFRGGGCYFGPDVTNSVLDMHGLKLLIRSHECKEEGYEYTHGGKLLTVFSASNYYDENSNKGAYVKILGEQTNGKPMCHVVQFVAMCRAGRRPTFTERISHLESSALNNVREMVISNRSELEAEFLKNDPNKTGMILSTQWCEAMESVMAIDVPWRLLRGRLVSSAVDGGSHRVLYQTTFHDKRVSFRNMETGGPSITESLYRHKDILETIFRTFDKDNSGNISMTEFTEACEILGNCVSLNLQKNQIEDIARSLDLNNDGQIDFNEFLEAFRIVDTQEKRERAAILFDI